MSRSGARPPRPASSAWNCTTTTVSKSINQVVDRSSPRCARAADGRQQCQSGLDGGAGPSAEAQLALHSHCPPVARLPDLPCSSSPSPPLQLATSSITPLAGSTSGPARAPSAWALGGWDRAPPRLRPARGMLLLEARSAARHMPSRLSLLCLPCVCFLRLCMSPCEPRSLTRTCLPRPPTHPPTHPPLQAALGPCLPRGVPLRLDHLHGLLRG